MGGLGFESAHQLLGLNLSRVVLAICPQMKGDQAATRLRNGFPKIQIEVWLLDMESYGTIREFVKRCESLPMLELVIRNAAVSNSERALSKSHISTSSPLLC